MTTNDPRGTASSWAAGGATAASVRHQPGNPPCQDAATASAVGRRHAAVYDGRGSSAHSHHGSGAAAAALERALRLVEPLLVRALDQLAPEDPGAVLGWHDAAAVILRALREVQADTALAQGVAPHELEFTVSLAVVGEQGLGLIQLGDSCVIVEQDGQTEAATVMQVGEFAGETWFLGPDDESLTKAVATLRQSAGLTAVLCITDGVAHRWLHAQTTAPAPGVARVLDKLRLGEWTAQHLRSHLEQPYWQGLGDDDRGVAYLVHAPAADQLTRDDRKEAMM